MRPALVYAGAVALATFVFWASPQIDMAVSALVYVPGRGFVLADLPPIVWLYRLVPWPTWAILAVCAVAGLWLVLTNRPLWRLDQKSLIFLVCCLALGPGLLANTLFKDHWGRARPTQIEAFGGTRQ